MFLPVTAAFLSGLVVGSFLPYFPLVSFGVLLAAAAVMTWLEAIKRLDYRQGLALYAALLSGTLYWTGCAWLTGLEDGLSTVGREPVTMIGTIVEPVRHSPERVVMVLSVSKVETAEGEQTRTGRVRVTWRHPDQDIRQGDTVTIHARIRPPTGVMNPGGFDYGQYLRLHHIDAVASISGPGSLSVQRPSQQGGYWILWQTIDGWRDRIRQAAETSLDQPALGLYLGMIIGEPDYLSPDVRDRFMSTGTVHILSISGSHLGLIAFLAFLMAKWVCRSLPAFWLLRLSRRLTPTRCAVLLTVTPVVLYTLLAGAQIATVRSLVMILLFLTAVWLGRPNSVVVALACAAWLLLLPDPNALFDISFQLSFLSVLAIGLVVRRFDSEETVQPPLLSWRERATLWVGEYVMLSTAVTLATLPLVAYHFNQIAWIGIISNVFVVPFAGFVLVPVGLASAMWLLLSSGDALPAAAIHQGLCDALMKMVDAFASIPRVEWHVASPSVFLVIAFYLMLCPLLQSRKVTWTKRACAVGIMLIMAWWAWSPRVWNGETVRVTFLDVGQGDACVIELPGGQTVLIDGGAAHDTLDMGRAVIGPFLWDQGIRRIDHVIGTHPQLDHIGGLPWVLRHFTVSHYWGNGMKREEAFYRRLDESLSEAHLSQELAVEGAVMVDSGGCRLRVLNPPLESGRVFMASETTRTGTVLNNQSVVTRLDCGSHSFLFTADIETETIGRLHRLHADAFRARIVKVPHHGARSSLDPAWIRETAPDLAVISVGRSNAYGHPAGPVLAAYAGHGIGLLRTDRDGAVQVLTNVSGNDVTIRLARDAVLQPVKIGRGMADEEAGNIRRLWEAWRPL